MIKTLLEFGYLVQLLMFCIFLTINDGLQHCNSKKEVRNVLKHLIPYYFIIWFIKESIKWYKDEFLKLED